MCAARALQPLLDVGQDDVFEVLGGEEAVQPQAFADLAGHAAHGGADGRDVDGIIVALKHPPLALGIVALLAVGVLFRSVVSQPAGYYATA